MDRFWEKVDTSTGLGPNGDCWEWLASGRGCGYGTIKFKGKLTDAHRVSFMLHNPEVVLTSKDFICHKCDNRKCVRIDHLFLGNAKSNALDMILKGRNNSPPLPKTIDCPEGTGWCSYCKSFKDISLFIKNRSTIRGIDGECKECKSIRNKKRVRRKV